MPLGRRERKLAATRLALLDALITRLAERPLEDIGVKELADAADVSEATFYNHFPSKLDLAVYFVQVWSIEAEWRARRADAAGPRAAIAEVFEATADALDPAPRVMGEVIAVQARMAGVAAPRPLTDAEKLLAYPDRPGVEQIDAIGFDAILAPRIARAIAQGDLPADTDPNGALLAFVSVFFGVPLILARRAPALVRGAYRSQLDIVWAGLCARSKETS